MSKNVFDRLCLWLKETSRTTICVYSSVRDDGCFVVKVDIDNKINMCVYSCVRNIVVSVVKGDTEEQTVVCAAVNVTMSVFVVKGDIDNKIDMCVYSCVREHSSVLWLKKILGTIICVYSSANDGGCVCG